MHDNELIAEMKRKSLAKIEGIFESIYKDVHEQRRLEIRLPTRAGPNRVVHYPGKNERESWRFAVVVKIMSLIRTNLNDGKLCTKRDLYYQDVALFKAQRNVDLYIEWLVEALGIERSHLNIVASPKGLMFGNLIIFNNETQFIRISTTDGPTIIPDMQYVCRIQLDPAVERVIVIEKEAVFQELYKHRSLNNTILVTGKGYPDINTRLLLEAISKDYKHISIGALIDSDPYGFQILATYKYGGSNCRTLGLPSLRYLGTKLLDLVDHSIPMSASDRNMGLSMLKKDWLCLAENAELKQEIQLGLVMSRKAEMNTLSSQQMIDYIQKKIEA